MKLWGCSRAMREAAALLEKALATSADYSKAKAVRASRGLSVSPKIAIGDGALGFWKALEEVLPATSQLPLYL